MFDVKNCLNECEEKMEMAAMYLEQCVGHYNS